MVNREYDFVVVGGGLAGVCCALAAARQGVSTALVQDRPVLGGNSSSEIRVPPNGSCEFHSWLAETGIVAELLLEDRANNPKRIAEGGTNCLYDMHLYGAVRRQANLALFLNTRVGRVEVEGRRVVAVQGAESGSDAETRFLARQFADCTGDGLLGLLAGAEYRYGREGRDEYGESLAPVAPDDEVLGSSLNFLARDFGRPVPFNAPAWAKRFESGQDIGLMRGLSAPREGELSGLWWLELSNPHHTLHDNGRIRDDLHSILLGIWDYCKNRDPYWMEQLRNYGLEWVGSIPGKREGARLLGDVVVSQNDLMENTRWPDAIVTSGDYIDLHITGGILNPQEPPELSFIDDHYRNYTILAPYTLPLRATVNRSFDNLWQAGRQMSLTHVAMAAARLQCTLGQVGQAVGTAAGMCLRAGGAIRPFFSGDPDHVRALQQRLVRDDVFIMGVPPDQAANLAAGARITASSEQALRCGRVDESCYEALDGPWGMVFPVTESRLDSVSAWLANTAGQAVNVGISLERIPDIWCNRPGQVVCSCTAALAAGHCGWLKIPLGLQGLPPGPYRLVLEGAGVRWHHARCQPPGTMGARRVQCPGGPEAKNRQLPAFAEAELQIPAFTRWNEKRAERFSFAMQTEPLQRPYGAENVCSGYDRPYRMPGLWASDPEQGLPQHLELAFGEPQRVTELALKFDCDLNAPYARMPGLWRAAECVRHWRLMALKGDDWETVYEESDNYQRLRRVTLPPFVAKALRIEVLGTNGLDHARIYDVFIGGPA